MLKSHWEMGLKALWDGEALFYGSCCMPILRSAVGPDDYYGSLIFDSYYAGLGGLPFSTRPVYRAH